MATKLKTNPELASSENIVKLVSPNPIIATLEFILLYAVGKFLGFILGSICGATLNIIIDGLFGKYIFNPFSWQIWVVVIIRGTVIAMAILVKKYISSKGNKNAVT